jgi:hypothetical protein
MFLEGCVRGIELVSPDVLSPRCQVTLHCAARCRRNGANRFHMSPRGTLPLAWQTGASSNEGFRESWFLELLPTACSGSAAAVFALAVTSHSSKPQSPHRAACPARCICIYIYSPVPNPMQLMSGHFPFQGAKLRISSFQAPAKNHGPSSTTAKGSSLEPRVFLPHMLPHPLRGGLHRHPAQTALSGTSASGGPPFICWARWHLILSCVF